MSSSSSSQILLSGWAHKEGGSVKTVKKRYFVLTPSYLHYYEDQSRSRECGSIALASITAVRKGQRLLTLEIVTALRTYVIMFSEDTDMDMWKSALDSAMLNLSPNKMEEVVESSTSSAASDKSYALYYFPSLGRAEPCRIVLELAGIPYQNVEILLENWPALKESGMFPNKTVPGLIVSNNSDRSTECVNDSIEILQYVGRLGGLTPPSDLSSIEEAFTRLFSETKEKVFVPRYAHIFGIPDEVRLEKVRELIESLEPVFDVLRPHFESEISGDFLFGDKPTWLDAFLFDILDQTAMVEGGSEWKKNPKNAAIAAFVDSFQNLPSISTYLSSDRRYKS